MHGEIGKKFRQICTTGQTNEEKKIEFGLNEIGADDSQADRIESYHEYEVARNREIIFQLIKDSITLSRLLEILDNSNLLQHSDRVMIERLKASLSCGIDSRNILERLAEIGKKSPGFLALVVSLAVYQNQ